MALPNKLPTTGVVDFAASLESYRPLSGGGGSSGGGNELAQATRLRGQVRSALKEYKRRDDGEDDHGLAVTRAIEEYLPWLVGIANAINADHLTGHLVFSWRSVLAAQRVDFVERPRVDVHSVESELAFVLITLALTYVNAATYHADRVPESTPEDGIDLSTRAQLRKGAGSGSRKKDADLGVQTRDVGGLEADKMLGLAVEHYCQAAGIFDFVAKRALSSDKDAPSVNSSGLPELNSLIVAGCSEVCLAKAEATAIRKLQMKAAHDHNRLNVSRPGLFAKLYINVASHYREALAFFDNAKKSTNKGIGPGLQELSQDMVKSVQQAVHFYSSMARKFLAIDAATGNAGGTGGSQGGQVQMGNALAFLESARKLMLESQSSTAVGMVKNLGKGRDAKTDMARMAREEVTIMDDLLAYYNKLNSTIHFQPKTSPSTINSLIPSGRSILTIKRYALPSPAFSPLILPTPEGRREPLNGEDVNDRHLDRASYDAPNAAISEKPSYALQGAYY